MKRLLIIAITLALGFNIKAQGSLETDQNPNFQNSLDKYKDSSYLALQGTTKQQTYKAIDPIEEKRELKALRKQHRANRPLWRHQRALKRIENTRYYANNNSNLYRGYGYQPNYRQNRYNRNYGSRWLNSGATFGLGMGLFGCSIFR